MGSLMLLDAASLYYRAFYGVPETITAPDGTPVNAVRGLLDMITRLVRGRSPGRLVACWDTDWRPAFRVEAIPTYKAHRAEADGVTEQTPPGLAVQVPVIEQVLTAAGLPIAGAPGYEADDVIGTLAARVPGHRADEPVGEAGPARLRGDPHGDHVPAAGPRRSRRHRAGTRAGPALRRPGGRCGR